MLPSDVYSIGVQEVCDKVRQMIIEVYTEDILCSLCRRSALTESCVPWSLQWPSKIDHAAAQAICSMLCSLAIEKGSPENVAVVLVSPAFGPAI